MALGLCGNFPGCPEILAETGYSRSCLIDSVIHSDGWRGYQGLIDVGYAKYFRVHQGENELARGNSYSNGIEFFWAYAKLRLAKLIGILAKTFPLQLK